MMMRRLYFFLLILLTAALPALAQSDIVIEPNKPLIVELSGTGAVEVIYRAQGAETISVQARSLEAGGTLDTTLEIVDAAQVRLGYNDDHGTPRADLAPFDSLIADVELPSAGDYLIRVNSFSGATAGRIELTLTSDAVAAEPTQQTGTDLEPLVIEGVVPNNESYSYSIALTAGQVITISVRATDNTLDPKIALISPEGGAVATNDDHGSTDTTLSRYDSRIANYAVTADGTYRVDISGFGGIGGTFEMTIEQGGGAGVEPTPPPREGVEVVRATITAGTPYEYYIDANAGDVITLTAQALQDTLDVDLAVYDLQDTLVDSNQEHGTADATLFFFDARINNLIIQQTGTYLIEVVGYDPSTFAPMGGDFELSIERVMTGAPTGVGDEQVFLGEIAPNGIFSQTFEAQTGDFITITVRSLSNRFDPIIDLLSPDGVLIANNDDHGTGSRLLGRWDSQIMRILITQSGTYTIEVGGYRDSGGVFGITVTTVR
jgi:hypothetical protein